MSDELIKAAEKLLKEYTEEDKIAIYDKILQEEMNIYIEQREVLSNTLKAYKKYLTNKWFSDQLELMIRGFPGKPSNKTYLYSYLDSREHYYTLSNAMRHYEQAYAIVKVDTLFVVCKSQDDFSKFIQRIGEHNKTYTKFKSSLEEVVSTDGYRDLCFIAKGTSMINICYMKRELIKYFDGKIQEKDIQTISFSEENTSLVIVNSVYANIHSNTKLVKKFAQLWMDRRYEDTKMTCEIYTKEQKDIRSQIEYTLQPLIQGMTKSYKYDANGKKHTDPCPIINITINNIGRDNNGMAAGNITNSEVKVLQEGNDKWKEILKILEDTINDEDLKHTPQTELICTFTRNIRKKKPLIMFMLKELGYETYRKRYQVKNKTKQLNFIRQSTAEDEESDD